MTWKDASASRCGVGTIDVAGTGFTVLDRIYREGQPTQLEELGGSCGNVLLSLAMLDHRVAPILSLGRDEVGQRLTREFESAGALTAHVNRRADRATPVLIQLLNPDSGEHRFSFQCPETLEPLPRYRSIDYDDVRRATGVLSCCRVFYTDRLSGPILEAMELASGSGALVFFEPSKLERPDLFRRAIKVAHVLKYSDEQLGDELNCLASSGGQARIITHGEKGLEVSVGENRVWCEAFVAPLVIDACGSGDMVSVGVIDRILADASPFPAISVSAILPGVFAGQRLAAANCSFPGARGLFRSEGPERARALLRS